MATSATNNTTIIFPFLKLPPELRLKVYRQLTPYNGHVREYKGLFLSCKQIAGEMKKDLPDAMITLLEDLEECWSRHYSSPLRIEKPRSLTAMQDMVIKMPKSILHKSRYNIVIPCLVVRDLAVLHVSRITFELYEDNADTSQDFLGIRFAIHVRALVRNCAQILIRRKPFGVSKWLEQVVFDWSLLNSRDLAQFAYSFADQDESKSMNDLWSIKIEGKQGRKLEICDNLATAVRGIWEKNFDAEQ